MRCQHLDQAMVLTSDNSGDELIFLYSCNWESSLEYAQKLESWLRKLAL